MQNNNQSNQYSEDEIDLKELIKTLIYSWKVIILGTLVFTLLALIYTTQKASKYESSILLELGSYETSEGKKLIEPVSSLIKELKVELIFKQKASEEAFKFKAIEDKLLQFSFTSSAILNNENLLNESLKFIQDRHTKITTKITTKISSDIKDIDNEINFLINSLEAEKETKNSSISNRIINVDNEITILSNSLEVQKEITKTGFSNRIKNVDNEINFLKTGISKEITEIDSLIGSLKSKIKVLKELVPKEEDNLTLLQSNKDALIFRTSSSPTLQQLISSYKTELIDLEYNITNLLSKKLNLEQQLKSSEADLISAELFELNQIKNNLEQQLISSNKSELIDLDNKLSNLLAKKMTLEQQLKSSEVDVMFTFSAQLFELNQVKNNLDKELQLFKNQLIKTGPIGTIETNDISNDLLTIILGAIVGFIFSVFWVFIKQAFIREQN